MRMHIELADDLVAKIDQLSGPRGRSAFVRGAVEHAVSQELRWAQIESAAGTIGREGHDWDANPARWVRRQRHSDTRRAG